MKTNQRVRGLDRNESQGEFGGVAQDVKSGRHKTSCWNIACDRDLAWNIFPYCAYFCALQLAQHKLKK